ncbi:alpha/beta hydrolase [Romeria aff. gracilis LEGE 07310]|uniref:Alpha/beta hydrolase n=1 Tax=Vasconcelosia minhoensis LEGE 07310 TaxID=915328 RepID=A0A8J7AFG2_9CYAN|nr:alpha/beta hydrolase [Romeria gracilis]MBE9078044.1 alpha/beta hydrolase [Romeria aff. gracilis LEGE 07310]
MAVVNILEVPHVYELTPPTQQSEALVFVHGWLLSRVYWQPLVQQLSPQYQCLTYDLRGFGQSNQYAEKRLHQSSQWSSSLLLPSPSRYCLAAYAEDLLVLLEKLRLDRVWLLGHSLGGSIALWAAHLMPHRVKGVICLNAGGGLYIAKEFERFRAAGQQMVRYRPAWLLNLPLLPYFFARMMVARPLSPHWGRQRLKDFLQANSEAALGALLESTTRAEVNRLPQVLAQLQQPVHFITASQDSVMSPRYVRHLASFHPAFRHHENTVVELADCGHMAMVEQPQRVAQIVEAIVNAHLPYRPYLDRSS